MAENSDNLHSVERENERTIEDLEKRAERGTKMILKSALETLRSRLKQIAGLVEKEAKIYDAAAKSRVETEKIVNTELAKLQQAADSEASERQRRYIEEIELGNQDRVLKYQEMIEKEGELEDGRYANSEALRDEYFSMGEAEWEKYADYVYNICTDSVKGLVSEEKSSLLSMFGSVRSEIEKSYETLMKTKSKMEGKLSDFGGLYRDVGNGSSKRQIRYDDISLDSIKDNTEALLNYEQNLTNAKKLLYSVFPTSGVEKETAEKNKEYIKSFFAELAGLSVSEGGMLASYLVMQPIEQSTEYLETWAKNQELAKSIARKLYSDEQAEVFDESAKNISNAFLGSLEKYFGTVPDEFYQKGALSAKGFRDGFKAEMAKVAADINLTMENIFSRENIGSASSSTVVNNSSYNIYSSQPENTALEIYKYDELKRMLVGG